MLRRGLSGPYSFPVGSQGYIESSFAWQDEVFSSPSSGMSLEGSGSAETCEGVTEAESSPGSESSRKP